jgi:hypothetical protein
MSQMRLRASSETFVSEGHLELTQGCRMIVADDLAVSVVRGNDRRQVAA